MESTEYLGLREWCVFLNFKVGPGRLLDINTTSVGVSTGFPTHAAHTWPAVGPR